MMYRAIIVEDELLIRVAYQSIVDWNAYGFELTGVFENGQAALDAFDEANPDFVLTDTKMPLCDGIELISEIKKRSPETVCIILSAYGDLDYVKEGMRVGADDYLLKLDITPERLGALLEETAQKLKKLKRSGVESVSVERQKGREEFLRRLIRGEYSERDTVLDYLKFYRIRLNTKRLICLSVSIAAEERQTLTEEMAAAVRQILLQTLQSAGTWALSDFQSNLFCAIGCCDEGVPELYGENVKKSVLFSLKSVLNLSDVMIQWKRAADIMDVPGVFTEIMPGKHADDSVLDVIQEIVDLLLRQQYEEVISRFRALSRLVSDTPVISLGIMRNRCSYILMSLQTVMKNDHILNAWFADRYPELTRELEQCFSQRDLTCWLEQLGGIFNEMSRTRTPAASISESAAEYIRLHFAEDLALGDIAGHCGISPTYLSRIFAQEKGKGILEYLTDMRIRHAKELLADTNGKIYEIAAEVGYSDAVYFNKVFKRNTGMTPKEYRMHKKTIKDKK